MILVMDRGMKNFRMIAAAALFAAAGVSSANAAPVVVDFDFTGRSDLVDSLTFTSGALELTASAGKFNANNKVLNNYNKGLVRQYQRGLGITSGPNDDFAAIDGTGVNEVLKMSLNMDATIKSLTFAAVGSDDEFNFFFDGNGDGKLESTGNRLDIDHTTGTKFGMFLFTDVWTSDLFGIGARYRRDTFFVKAASFSYDDGSVVATPVAGALPMMLTALVGVGLVGGWRRRKA